jgi:CRP/FNR family transcriptional regulator
MQAQALSTMANSDVAALAVCRGLDRRVTSHVMAISSLRRKAAGEVLFGEGESADSIFEVVSGTVRLYKLLPDGRRQIVGFPSACHLLGLAPAGAHVYTAEALTDVVLCRYPRASFQRLANDMPGLAQRMWAVTSDELRFAQDQLLLLGRKTATERVASFLLMLAEQQEGNLLSLPMTRTDIGDYLGITVETVSRTLTKLRREKLIALPRVDAIEILDREALDSIAAGEAPETL